MDSIDWDHSNVIRILRRYYIISSTLLVDRCVMSTELSKYEITTAF